MTTKSKLIVPADSHTKTCMGRLDDRELAISMMVLYQLWQAIHTHPTTVVSKEKIRETGC
jgi:hypothetical protein